MKTGKDSYIKIRDAAKVLGVEPNIIRDLCVKKMIPSQLRNGSYCICTLDLEKYAIIIKEIDNIDSDIAQYKKGLEYEREQLEYEEDRLHKLCQEKKCTVEQLDGISRTLQVVLKSLCGESLTDRELDIAILKIQKVSTKMIADKYGLMESTVRTIWTATLRKIAKTKTRKWIIEKDAIIAEQKEIIENQNIDIVEQQKVIQGLMNIISLSDLQKIPYNSYVKWLTKPLVEYDFSVRAVKSLRASNIHTLYDLVQKNKSDLLKIKNLGIKTITEIENFLKQYNLTFGMEVCEIDEIIKEYTDKNDSLS
ncbi:MAG: hypothetical protein NC083_09015 [Muribaculum sp.]|nr:hypothetical protein [Muribaculum sp.]MCM1577086.1 hypothetical protein [Bacteroides sp.]